MEGLSTLLASMSTIFTQQVSWTTEIGNLVTATPILLIFACAALAKPATRLLRSLMRL